MILQDEDVVAEHDGLVSPLLVQPDQVLADLQLARVAGPRRWGRVQMSRSYVLSKPALSGCVLV